MRRLGSAAGTATSVVVGLLVLAGCGGAPDASPGAGSGPASSTSASPAPSGPEAAPSPSTSPAPTAYPARGKTVKVGLRGGERFATLRMPAAYTPKAPSGSGTDDYRCFLLDPKLKRDALVTGADVLPGNARTVHHVILFKVDPDQVALAQAKDAQSPGAGWTCFGGTGVGGRGGLDSAPWIAGWAPGGGERVMSEDIGIPIGAGSRVVMQMHYNLLQGPGPDVSAARLRLVDDDGSRDALQTTLLPAPVELPCRPASGRTPDLCYRTAAMDDVKKRFGQREGRTGDLLHFLCGSTPNPGATQTCDRTISQPATVRAVAGHMHLLGRSISIQLNAGKSGARTLLDIPIWDFDDQGSRPLPKPVKLKAGDTLTVTCTHDQTLRDRLPAFEGQPDRYVVWGEGTTDEMCLGIVLVTRP